MPSMLFWYFLSIFSAKGLDHGPGLCKGSDKTGRISSISGLRNFSIYIYSNVGLPAAWKNVTKKKNRLVAVSVSVALGTSLESGGRIKRQSVFEGAEP